MTELSFKPLSKDDSSLSTIKRPSVSYWQDAWARLKRHKLAMVGLGIIILMLLFAILGPYFSSISYSDQDLCRTFESPSAKYPMGTDNLGRSVFIRLAYGARISLTVGIVATIIALGIGVIYGTVAAFSGGVIENIMMRIVEVLMSVPKMLIVILLMTVLKPGLSNVFLVLGIAGWLDMARLVRGEVLSLKEREYILASRISGVSRWNIMLKHLIPNAMGPIIVATTLSVPGAIFLESFLSFMGLGVSAPMASWGSMASEGITSFRSYPHLLFFPAMFISVTILGFNLLGDSLRDVLDPKMKK